MPRDRVRQVANPRLRSARMRRGWTEADVAVRLHQLAAELGEAEPGVDSNQVSRWERGVCSPGRHYRPRLCLVFDAMPEEIGFPATPRLSEDVGDLARERLERRPAERGRLAASDSGRVCGLELSELALPRVDRPRLALILEHSWPADVPLLDGLEAAAHDLSVRCETEAPEVVVPALRGNLGVLQELLSRPQAPALEARLQAVGSRVAELVGFASFVSGRRADAYTAYALAETLGREAGSGELVAVVLTAKSRMYSRTARDHGDPERGISLLDAAERSAGPAAPPALRGWVHGRRAEEYAELGEDVRSGRDLETAYLIVDAASPSDWNLFSTLDSAWLDSYAGACAVKLGRTTEAIGIYDAIRAVAV